MTDDGLHATLRALEVDLLAPESRHSEPRLDRLLADEFVEVGSSGRIFDKRSIMSLLAAPVFGERLAMRDFKVVAANSGQALVTYSCDAYNENGELQRSSHRSSFWIESDLGWQLLYHQGTLSA